MKNSQLASRVISILIVVISISVFAAEPVYDYFHPDQVYRLHLLSYRALTFAFGVSLGILLFVYGVAPIKRLLRELFQAPGELSEWQLIASVSLMDFLIRLSAGIGRIGMVLAFLNLSSPVFDPHLWHRVQTCRLL